MKKVDPAAARAAVLAVADWIRQPQAHPRPARGAVAEAVRATARTLAQDFPGHTVELRVPPFVAVQCLDGPRHTRGTPPNVVEADDITWLRLATGLTDFDEAVRAGRLEASGSRADNIAAALPVLPLPE